MMEWDAMGEPMQNLQVQVFFVSFPSIRCLVTCRFFPQDVDFITHKGQRFFHRLCSHNATTLQTFCTFFRRSQLLSLSLVFPIFILRFYVI